ncbi:MAG: hypothetical protein JST54_00605 [Deltaproteobacteria bacterium]|nr:hypothetical protein [Deltaproteobacteria bacterium]
MHTLPGAFQKLQQLYADGVAAIEERRFEDAIAKFTEGLAIDDHFRHAAQACADRNHVVIVGIRLEPDGHMLRAQANLNSRAATKQRRTRRARSS